MREDMELRSVWATLKAVYVIVPVVAGLDKFTNLLVDWTKYIAPPIAHALPISPHGFMILVGLIEIVAGIGVFFWTRPFAIVVGAWLLCIALNLVIGGYYDIAVRDIAMAVSSFCLARLTVPGVARDMSGVRQQVTTPV